MICRAGQSAKQLRVVQPARIDHENLPWPLSVPWSGSFVSSQNPTRDFWRHAVYAAIEAFVVPLYRDGMIKKYPEVGELRNDISSVLENYNTGEIEYAFPDGIKTPTNYSASFAPLQEVIRSEKISTSFAMYTNEVNEIVKMCAKQSVMLAHPSHNLDSHRVREAFDGFISVSGIVIFKTAS